MMKVISIVSLEKTVEIELEKAFEDYGMNFKGIDHIKENDLLDAEVILGWDHRWEKLILTNPFLKWVQLWLAGVESIPLKQLSENNVVVTNSSGVSAKNMSEQIIGYMIMFERNLHLTMRNQIKHSWQEDMKFGELSDKTIGIIGVGQIGGRLAQLAKAFGMHTLGIRHSKTPTPYIDDMYDLSQLSYVLEQSDYIVNTLPLTQLTYQLFNTEQFEKVKTGAFYINVGRGKTTSTQALLNALKTGKLQGAALDVFEEEPLPAEHPLWTLENVIITPHIAGDTDRYNERLVDLVLYNLKAYKQDTHSMKNVIQASRQY
ncbi:D-2-hydroxyacid dehydrogenase [Paenibacillus xylanexedens]|uniref:D-2-hydroxyacid dehydrogenase n=1 Tax=Paenibacillus xylanexedens TaxID=528191 RepID=UPI0028E84CEC|nr:D-2-hydroxyacid dehydrogenase [Paenibacillus xylanexedens]